MLVRNNRNLYLKVVRQVLAGLIPSGSCKGETSQGSNPASGGCCQSLVLLDLWQNHSNPCLSPSYDLLLGVSLYPLLYGDTH
jgi:hypothetical protein